MGIVNITIVGMKYQDDVTGDEIKNINQFYLYFFPTRTLSVDCI